MQENGCALTAAYAIGGVYPDGSGKTGYSAEIGLFRNNWGMITECCSGYIGASADQWNSLGLQIHNDDNTGVRCQKECRNAMGLPKFFARQRAGTNDTSAGQPYADAIYGTYMSFLQSDGGVHMSDGMATCILKEELETGQILFIIRGYIDLGYASKEVFDSKGQPIFTLGKESRWNPKQYWLEARDISSFTTVDWSCSTSAITKFHFVNSATDQPVEMCMSASYFSRYGE
ncbi:uncharacterized protein KY384_006283 [Bacidia gigantensis]|uniref:uncharacterized protein n=1 Tax=Bacidia gigantensis TaxID=2732470 RepID=UPI001D049B85|nr:uncharacterized protein KY384_006283 [Bacidia gigantensis]KAG8528596.1 hypothetical protein KY384_006283 [Bacidia gigantensis]